VIWTGDSARHDSDESIPRSADQVLNTNQLLSDKIIETFTSDKNPSRLSIPVVPTFGNNDILPHNILLPGPNRWLQRYAEMWKTFIPEEQLHSFEFGGWFSVEVVPGKLAVFSLNTLYFFDRNAGVDGCAAPSEPGFKQMEWLRIQLQSLRTRGVKAILMGHVPPARTDSKQLWDETCWQKYSLWLKQYRDVIAGSVYGHMNIDHFVLHDTKEIDVMLAGGTAEDQKSIELDDFLDGDGGDLVEEADNHVAKRGVDDYLQELRQRWSKLPSIGHLDGVAEDASVSGKHKKKKGKNGEKHKDKPLQNLGGKWAERFHVSLISPSIVPNYFPTLRVVEYNISGMGGDTLSWYDANPGLLERGRDAGELADDELDQEIALAARLAEKNRKGGGKGKKPKNPSLVVPSPPPKSSPPGPAYSPQLFSFTGYTQYFANLTDINNDISPYEADEYEHGELEERKWRDGTHSGKKPKSKKPEPKEFRFEVEYDTFSDKIYKLSDLTVKSYLKLASRIAKSPGKKGKSLDTQSESDDISVHDWEGVEVDTEEADEGVEAEGKKHKKKHHNNKKKKNKVWLHFLKHAFVSTEDKKDLEKLGD